MNPRLADPDSLLELLAQWTACGWLRELDLALVRFLDREVPGLPGPVLLAAALASHQLGRGHVCLDLAATLAEPGLVLSLPPAQDTTPSPTPVLTPQGLLAGFSLAAWQAALACPSVVADGADGSARTPLVLAGRRLYLRRYWSHERAVEAALTARCQAEPLAVDPGALAPLLAALFPDVPPSRPDWQKVACALALRRRFAVITGGPGTGKTTTVVRLLALLQAQALASGGQALRIRLAAPTGKAAARLRSAILAAIDHLPPFVHADAALRAAIPDEVTTLHRLLGSRPDSRQFRHHARAPLAVDVLVVDEASMVDLEMMAGLLAALPASARLILLGDKDQLASVEAGSVLGELCEGAERGSYWPATADWLAAASGERLPPAMIDHGGRPLDQQIVMLRDSRRFSADSAIGRLATAVNAGNAAGARASLPDGRTDVRHLALAGHDDPRLAPALLGDATWIGLTAYLEALQAQRPAVDADASTLAAWAADLLARHARFQLLCAVRQGPAGVAGLNQRCEHWLAAAGLIDPSTAWYAGRPVLITRNDYSLGLMNGDIGLTLPCPVRSTADSAPSWGLRVAFADPEAAGGVRWVLPSRLSAVDTVYAMTVHKAQGSEFEHCALLLPSGFNPVLTRELIYTGITRARRQLTLLTFGAGDPLAEGIGRRVQRAGGLFARD